MKFEIFGFRIEIRRITVGDKVDYVNLSSQKVPTPSEQLQAELEPLPETYYPPKKKLEDALKEGAPLLGTYPGKFHVG